MRIAVIRKWRIREIFAKKRLLYNLSATFLSRQHRQLLLPFTPSLQLWLVLWLVFSRSVSAFRFPPRKKEFWHMERLLWRRAGRPRVIGAGREGWPRRKLTKIPLYTYRIDHNTVASGEFVKMSRRLSSNRFSLLVQQRKRERERDVID